MGHSQVPPAVVAPFKERAAELATSRFGGPFGIMTQVVRDAVTK